MQNLNTELFQHLKGVIPQRLLSMPLQTDTKLNPTFPPPQTFALPKGAIKGQRNPKGKVESRHTKPQPQAPWPKQPLSPQSTSAHSICSQFCDGFPSPHTQAPRAPGLKSCFPRLILFLFAPLSLSFPFQSQFSRTEKS